MNSDKIIKLVYRNDYDALRRLVAKGVDLNMTDGDGRTPLMHAVLASDAESEMVHFLVANGANPNLHDGDQKWTALHFAARDQKLPIVVALLEHGAAIDAEDRFGNTPLWRSVMDSEANPEVIKSLLAEGARPDKKNLHGVSPRELAEGSTDLVKLFGA